LNERFPGGKINPFQPLVSGQQLRLPAARVVPRVDNIPVKKPTKEVLVRSFLPQTTLELLPVGTRLGEIVQEKVFSTLELNFSFKL
jgi:hypothetical protein